VSKNVVRVVAATIIGHVFDVRRYPTRRHFATVPAAKRCTGGVRKRTRNREITILWPGSRPCLPESFVLIHHRALARTPCELRPAGGIVAGPGQHARAHGPDETKRTFRRKTS
jgi:hypothetical protein